MASTRVRLDPQARREQLLDLGVRILATRPLEDLSIDVLAEEAGISRGLLYHYFRNKQEFHRAVVRRATDEMLAVTEPDPSLDGLSRLSAGMAAYVDYVEHNYEPFLSLIRGAASGDRFLSETYEDVRSRLTERIVAGLGDLGVEDTPAARLMTGGWAAMVEEAVISWVQHRQVSKEDLVRLLTESLPAVLGATQTPAGPARRAD